MNHQELCRARDAEDWNALWLEARTIVNAVVGSMYAANEIHNAEREDVLQEGYLAAGSAIRSWEPIEGTFNTWVTRITRGCILKSLNKLDRTHLASADVENLTDADAPPTERGAEVWLVRSQLARLDLRERQFIERAYGIDCPEETHEQIARSKGLSQQRVTEIINRALRKLGASA